VKSSESQNASDLNSPQQSTSGEIRVSSPTFGFQLSPPVEFDGRLSEQHGPVAEQIRRHKIDVPQSRCLLGAGGVFPHVLMTLGAGNVYAN
jgi:hypothetical protein